MLEPWEAATLAAIIASPSAYDPKVYPENSLMRRNIVLEKMYEQGYSNTAGLAFAACFDSFVLLLMSRWTMLCACAYSSASATSTARRTASSAGSCAELQMRAQRGSFDEGHRVVQQVVRLSCRAPARCGGGAGGRRSESPRESARDSRRPWTRRKAP